MLADFLRILLKSFVNRKNNKKAWRKNYMWIFDDIERNYKGPANFNESTYEYLNRSARETSAKIRNLIEEWFANYPDNEKTELATRLKTRNNIEFQAAFFELYCFTLFSKQGFILEPHPAIENTDKHPDFLVYKDGTPIFYLECTLASFSAEENAVQRTEKQIIDLLNQLETPEYFILQKIITRDILSPSVSKMRKYLQRKISSMNKDAFSKFIIDPKIKNLPQWEWKDTKTNWQLLFSPIPKSEKIIGKENIRSIGMILKNAKFLDSTESLRNSLRKKANRYGKNLKYPYYIAVNCLDPTTDEYDIDDVLFGTKCIYINTNTGETLPGRKDDGFWCNLRNPKNIQVSGILIGVGIDPYTIARNALVLWENPWANKKFIDVYSGPKKIPNVEKRVMEHIEGIKIDEILGISEEWPN